MGVDSYPRPSAPIPENNAKTSHRRPVRTSKLFQLSCQLKNFVGLNTAPFFWFQEEQKVLFNMFTGH